MQQTFRIGVVVSALLIAAAGCASTQGTSDEARVSPALSEGDGRPAVVAAQSNARSPAETLNVLFAFGRWDLSSAAQTELQPLVRKVRENSKLTVDLEGYADSVGTRDYNLQLSQKRVEAVRRYLVEKGVEPSRIRSDSLGQLPDGGTAEERAKNRRVTIKLMISQD